MAGLELVLLLLAVSAGLRIVADRLTIPYSALLVVGGLALAFMPNLPRVELAPDVLFLVFVPPLLYWGAASFPLRDFWHDIGPILRLAGTFHPWSAAGHFAVAATGGLLVGAATAALVLGLHRLSSSSWSDFSCLRSCNR